MSKTTPTSIEINDLPPEETLSPEEKEQLAGAGRFRPMFESLETRDMMSTLAAVTPTQPPGGTTLQTTTPNTTVNYDGATDASTTFAPLTSGANVQNYGASDASAAIPVRYIDPTTKADSSGTLIGDDKSDFIRLYDSTSGKLVTKYDLSGVSGKTASDIEAVARYGDMAIWMTSHATIYVTRMQFDNTGNFLGFVKDATTGKVSGQKIEGLWGQLAESDAAKGTNVYNQLKVQLKHGDGTPYTLSQVMKLDPTQQIKGVDYKNYCNIEGFGIRSNADGSMTAYIGFRAPLVSSGGKALVLTVTNFQHLLTPPNDGTTFRPTVERIKLDLGGRGIRDIVYNEDWESFVVLGGNAGTGAGATLSTRLYVWDGTTNIGAVGNLQNADFPTSKWGGYMSFEAIGQMTGNLATGNRQVQLFADDGSSAHGKDLADWNKRWFNSYVHQVPTVIQNP